MPNSLSEIRAEIDAADASMVLALGRRMHAVAKLVPLKEGQPVTDTTREDEVRAHWMRLAETHGLTAEFATAVLEIVFAESKRIQRS